MNFGSILHIVLILLSPLFALAWSMILLFKKEKIKAHTLMGTIFLVFTIAYFLFISYFTPAASMVSGICYMFFALAIPPLHIFFFKIVTDPTGIEQKDFLIFIPNILLVVITIVLNIVIGSDAADALFRSLILEETDQVPTEYITTAWKLLSFFCYWCFRYLLLAEILVMQIWAFIRIRKYNRTIDDYYSDPDRRGKRSTLIVFIAMMVTLLAALGLLAKPFHHIEDNEVMFILMSVCVSIGIFMTGYYSDKITFTAEQFEENIKADCQKNVKEENAPVNEQLFAQCVSRLKILMGEQQAYLNPELSLVDVATAIGTNRTYLAQIIHHYYNCSFSDYINLQRIEHSETLLQKNSDMTMLDIATMSGYITLSSFYRNFEKFTKTTPIKWRNQFKI